MAFNVTQCPVCESTFNTNARILESAVGRVRCGACLAVFDAAKNYIEETDSDSGYHAGESVFVGNNPQEFFDPSLFLTRSALTEVDDTAVSPGLENSDGEILIDEDPLAGYEQTEAIDKDFAETVVEEELLEENLAEEELVEEKVPEESFTSDVHVNRDANPDIENRNFGEELKSPILDWSALDGKPSSTEPSQEEEDEPTLIQEPSADEEQELEAEHSSDTEPPKEFEKEESINAEEISDNPEPEEESEEIADDPGPEEESEEQAEESSDAIRARALETELEDEEALEAIPEESLAVLGKMSTPLELPLARNSRWGRHIAFSLAILFLGALLTAQFLWQGIEVYSKRTQIRPFYELTCNWLNCELPAYSEIGAIRSDNLAVRNHPELANGLMVNTTIRNTADFPQAFPIMVLSFNSASNSIVALREFAPEEYLDPGLLSFSTMPVMTPVQIDLEIIDPGPDAVNYTLAFRLP